MQIATEENSAPTEEPMTEFQDRTDPNPDAEVLQLSLTQTVRLFKKRNCNVSLSVVVKSAVVHPGLSVSDTGAGPKLVSGTLSDLSRRLI